MKVLDKAEFVIDTDMVIEKIDMDNVRKARVFVNDTMYYIDKGFSVKNGDNIKIKIRQFDEGSKSTVKFIGYDPSSVYKKDYVPENVSDEVVKHEDIVIE